MNELTKALEDVLQEAGAALVGFADMSGMSGAQLPYGVAVALPVPKHIVRQIEDGPTKDYYDMYYELNGRLNEIVTAGSEFLRTEGYEAFPQTTDNVVIDEDWCTRLPHKTVAARAGLGWIGKNCLLVTPEYGSAIRISSLLTNAVMTCAKPIVSSKCGNCCICEKACPAQAIKGQLWEAGMPREALFEKEICKEKQIELMEKRTGIRTDLCGKCFVVCPYTRRYVGRF